MRKKIMQVGNSLGLIFSKNECELYGIKIGNIIDIDDMLIFAKKRKKVKSKDKYVRSKSK